MTPVEVMIATLLFGTCVFAVGLLAYRRLGKLQSLGADPGRGTARHLFPQGELTITERTVLEKILGPSKEIREKK